MGVTRNESSFADAVTCTTIIEPEDAKGHQMPWTSWPGSQNAEGYNYGWVCDKCSRLFNLSGGRWHCAQCSADICSDCQANKMDLLIEVWRTSEDEELGCGKCTARVVVDIAPWIVNGDFEGEVDLFVPGEGPEPNAFGTQSVGKLVVSANILSPQMSECAQPLRMWAMGGLHLPEILDSLSPGVAAEEQERLFHSTDRYGKTLLQVSIESYVTQNFTAMQIGTDNLLKELDKKRYCCQHA